MIKSMKDHRGTILCRECTMPQSETRAPVPFSELSQLFPIAGEHPAPAAGRKALQVILQTRYRAPSEEQGRDLEAAQDLQ